MKETMRWFSDRMKLEVNVVRWGTFGTPLLLFPTAGGDAEEVERFHLIDALGPLLAAGRIKVYSCDSLAGRAMLEEKPAGYCAWLLNQYQLFVRYEMVPAIHADCRTSDIPIIVTGSSIGAFNSLSILCRFPDVFHKALCMSGTYDMQRFLKGDLGPDFYFASPLHFVPNLSGEQLDLLKTRFVLLASGQGRAENIGESWRVADVLGAKGIPNRVDPWGAEWHHDWPTWRHMLPQYLEEFL